MKRLNIDILYNRIRTEKLKAYNTVFLKRDQSILLGLYIYGICSIYGELIFDTENNEFKVVCPEIHKNKRIEKTEFIRDWVLEVKREIFRMNSELEKFRLQEQNLKLTTN